MHDIARRPRFLTALGLALPLLAAAQTAAPPPNVPERALRDAERVLSIIKFHAVRSSAATKPRRAAATSAQPPKPTTSVDRPAAPATPTGLASTTEAISPPRPDPSPPPADEPPVAATPPTATASPIVAVPQSAASTDITAAGQETSNAAAPSDDAHGDDIAEESAGLQMRNYVEPVLPPSTQATLGSGLSRVWVRFTVATDGTVTQAEAVAGAPRRLARPATEAVLQWQFEPVPQPRTAEVEIVFKRN